MERTLSFTNLVLFSQQAPDSYCGRSSRFPVSEARLLRAGGLAAAEGHADGTQQYVRV